MRRFDSIFSSLVVLALAVQLVLASTAGSEPANPGRGGEALRVAALLPWVADAVALAGPGATLVAGVRRQLHEPLPGSVVDLGNPHSPNLERLAEARPALVVADTAIHARFAAPIEKLGAKLLLLETGSVDETLAALRRLAEALGGATPLVARIEAVADRLAELAGQSDASVVALFGAPGTFYVMTERAWLGDLARHLGFGLAVAGTGGDERFPGLVAVSDEAMATTRPDLVLLVAHGDPARIQAELERRTAGGGPWSGLATARLGIHVLDPGLFSANPGLELARAAEMLAALAVPASASAATGSTEAGSRRALARETKSGRP